MKIVQTNPFTSVNYIGIDISKDTLDIHGIPKFNQVPNTAAGHRKIISHTPEGSRIVFEATGGYEKALWLTLLEAGITVSRINPSRIRDLAKSVGQIAKTDKIDAKMIAFYGEKLTPRADVLPSEHQRKLESLVQAREQLISSRAMQTIQIKQHTDKEILKIFTQVNANLLKQIKKLDTRIAQQLGSAEHKDQARRLQQISGVGPITTATLLAFMPELGQMSGNQAAALVGVAPHNDDSAKSNKKRHIRGGRSRVRKVLYMSATTAIRFNPILKALYLNLISKGKAHKAAIVAVMRKLIILLNRLLKDENFKLA
jgi:transposase